MVRVRLLSSDWHPEENTLIPQVLTELVVEGRDVQVEDRYRYLLDIAVLDPESGQKLAFEDDPERWAMLLPSAFRSGDPVVEVQEVHVPATAAIRRRW